LQKECEAIFAVLCNKLDALSNFHFTPKLPSAEIEVVKNVAAISMEEILPMAVNDRVTAAPEEVYEKKRGRCESARMLDRVVVRHPSRGLIAPFSRLTIGTVPRASCYAIVFLVYVCLFGGHTVTLSPVVLVARRLRCTLQAARATAGHWLGRWVGCASQQPTSALVLVLVPALPRKG
jgi:hypothetical protein